MQVLVLLASCSLGLMNTAAHLTATSLLPRLPAGQLPPRRLLPVCSRRAGAAGAPAGRGEAPSWWNKRAGWAFGEFELLNMYVTLCMSASATRMPPAPHNAPRRLPCSASWLPRGCARSWALSRLCPPSCMRRRPSALLQRRRRRATGRRSCSTRQATGHRRHRRATGSCSTAMGCLAPACRGRRPPLHCL